MAYANALATVVITKQCSHHQPNCTNRPRLILTGRVRAIIQLMSIWQDRSPAVVTTLRNSCFIGFYYMSGFGNCGGSLGVALHCIAGRVQASLDSEQSSIFRLIGEKENAQKSSRPCCKSGGARKSNCVQNQNAAIRQRTRC